MGINVLVVLQTHSKGDSQHYLGLNQNERFVKQPKSEITRRCTRSLVETMNYAKELYLDSTFELVVFDDHSDESTVNEIKNNLNIATFKTQFIALDTYGIMPSILRCYEHGRDYGKEIVYFAQDDYLYDTTALYDMIETMMFTSHALGNYTSIYPYDDPYKYIPENTAVQSHIIRRQGRHWRTLPMTASCFMTHHKVITDNWDVFEAMGKHPVDSKMEDNTINQLFRKRGYYLFVPIPSLALHMQYDTEEDDQINWREWWDRYDRPEPLTPTIDNTVLNVGFGGISIKDLMYTEVFEGMREITLDIDNKFNPDILADVTDISHIPDNYVNCAYTSHMIEHIDYFKVPSVINELLRVCKPGGYVRILTPNLQTIGEKIMSGDLLDVVYDSAGGPISPIDIIYGHRHSVHRNRVDFMIHRTGFSKKVFEHIAKEYNFDMDIKEVGFDLLVDVKKH
jgi:predicted SAM-dependent methyltransferase